MYRDLSIVAVFSYLLPRPIIYGTAPFFLLDKFCFSVTISVQFKHSGQDQRRRALHHQCGSALVNLVHVHIVRRTNEHFTYSKNGPILPWTVFLTRQPAGVSKLRVSTPGPPLLQITMLTVRFFSTRSHRQMPTLNLGGGGDAGVRTDCRVKDTVLCSTVS